MHDLKLRAVVEPGPCLSSSYYHILSDSRSWPSSNLMTCPILIKNRWAVMALGLCLLCGVALHKNKCRFPHASLHGRRYLHKSSHPTFGLLWYWSTFHSFSFWEWCNLQRPDLKASLNIDPSGENQGSGDVICLAKMNLLPIHIYICTVTGIEILQTMDPPESLRC